MCVCVCVYIYIYIYIYISLCCTSEPNTIFKATVFQSKKIISSFCIAQGTLLKVVAAWMGGEFGGEWIHMTEFPLLST